MNAVLTKERRFPLNVRLREARIECGWSQGELADKIGTTWINVSRWENGLTFPSPHNRQQLRDIFSKTYDELGLVRPSTPTSEITPIPKIWNVPLKRNQYFTGRESLLAVLHGRLMQAKKKGFTGRAQALCGLGGIGKTQVAVEYAYHYRDHYTHTIWISAASHETLVADFVTLAKQLNLPEKDKDDLSVVEAVKRWLSKYQDWLIILDNADDLQMAQEFLPTDHKGFIIYTTRAQATGIAAAPLEVEPLSRQDGATMLLRWIKRLDIDAPLEQALEEDRHAAEAIAQEMDGLPLAIVQAAAFVEETGCGLENYPRLYQKHRRDLLERHSRLMFNYPATVATTWSLSFEQVERASPCSADFLRLFAFLAPDAIPEELLTRGAAELGAEQGAAATNPLKLNEALEVLRRYSLVRRNTKTQTISIHRLVQTVIRESMDETTRRAWAERTVRVVNAAFPDDEKGVGDSQRFSLPHVQECAALIKQYALSTPEAARLLHKGGASLYARGFHHPSQILHQQALAIRRQLYGPADPAVAESLNWLALVARVLNNYTEAEAYHLQALAIRRQALGMEDLWTAESLNNLGVLYRYQERYEEAEPLLQQALAIRKGALGFDHSKTLITFMNLAKLYAAQRYFEQAERLFKQALAAFERVVGSNEPLFAQNLNWLARLYFELGKYEWAEQFWSRSLAILERSLGPEHPTVAERLNDLAELAEAQGKYRLALSLCQKAIRNSEKRLGPEHPETITYHKHLASITSTIEAEQDSHE